MIISRTPFRVSLVGGGTDLPEFYRAHGHGAVLSMSICQYMYIVIHPYFHDKIRIKYARTEDVERLEDIEHPIVRECLQRLGVEVGVEIASFADVASGTGLGSSSSFTVGLLHALYAYKGMEVSPQQLAEEACDIEINVLQEPIGKQDQYAAAFGGLNKIIFNHDETVQVQPLALPADTRQALQDQLALYYVGGSRRASQVLAEQKANLTNKPAVREAMLRMRELVNPLADGLARGDTQALGKGLHQAWMEKRELASLMSNSHIDDLYSRARESGASGGKLLGAGGTGFLLLCHADHSFLQQQLTARVLPVAIDDQGSQLIYNDHV